MFGMANNLYRQTDKTDRGDSVVFSSQNCRIRYIKSIKNSGKFSVNF